MVKITPPVLQFCANQMLLCGEIKSLSSFKHKSMVNVIEIDP